jgi:tetratricopeptide (TPR) repeat protein
MPTNRAPALLAALALAALSVSAHAAEKVELRAGEHEGYGRIAIQWPMPVAYQAKLEGQTLVIHFARPFTAQLNIISRNLDHYIANAAQSADGMTITAKLLRPIDLKSETVDHNIIAIDLVQKIETLATKPDAKMLAKGKLIQAPPPKTEVAKAEVAQAAPAKPEPAKPEPAKSAAAKAKPEQIASLEAPAQAAPLAVVPPAGVGAASNPNPAAGEAVVASIAPAETKSAGPEAAAPASQNTSPSGTVAPQLITESGQISLRFDWPSPTAAAVYRRSSALWLVFAAATKLDLDSLRAHSQGVLSAIDAVPAGTGTALRLVVADGLNPSVRRAGNSWIVDLKRVAPTPDAPITVDPRPSATVPSVELHVHQAAAPLTIKDPVMGDKLVVVPVGELGRGIDAARSFVDFRLLESVQGVVIRPNTDDLAVLPERDAVQITRPHGLALSDEHDRLLGGVPTDLHRLFDFAAWNGPDTETFIERRVKLERAAADAPPAARTMPRLDLARFYFAHLFAAESLGVLAQIEHDDPASATDRGVQALKGAACFLADDRDCAKTQLNLATFDQEPEIALWRGAFASDMADWNTAAREFTGSIGVIATYPKVLRDRFALAAAEAMIETDRGSASGPLLETVLKDAPSASDKAMAEFLSGRREQELGQLEPALEAWIKVAASGDRKARARALYARAMALYDNKQTSRLDTINALDALRFSWRGDAFEFTLLRQLGELQLAEGDVDGGIEALHEAAIYFPDYPASKDVAKEAADSFAGLYLGKNSDDVPPVKALALYTEFQDLEPSGDRHDEIVHKLIDRLVAVDLLDQATSLLDDQVKNHLSGHDKARGSTQLALLRLMNRQPDAAIAALDVDVGKDIPADLIRQRQELRARALTDLNKVPDALALLQNDNSVDAARLRADIYWRQQDWKNAAKVFGELAGAPPAQGPLGVDLSRILLAWAAALTLDGNQDGLDKLRTDWAPAIAGTQTAQAFNLITEGANAGVAGGGTAADVATRVAEIGNLQSFMAAYRKRLASDGLNAAVN